MDMAERLNEVRRQIAGAAERAGRDPDDIRLMAVTKGIPPAKIDRVAALGVTEVGENRVQEGRSKWKHVKSPLHWHFIGHLQSNKVKYVLRQYILLHSLDRMSLARELSRRLEREGREMECLVQVNVAREAQKHGLDPDQVVSFVDEVRHMPGISIVGLMTIPPYSDDPEASRPHYRCLSQLARDLERREWPGVKMRELSMGMSGDFTVAVAEGATIVRVGSAIFRGDDR